MYCAPYGECPRCGFKVRLPTLRAEWTGLRVCGDCWDPRPADTRPPYAGPEGLPRWDASPATEPFYRAEGDKGDQPFGWPEGWPADHAPPLGGGGLFDPAFFDPAFFG
jgi:hypothetical protein